MPRPEDEPLNDFQKGLLALVTGIAATIRMKVKELYIEQEFAMRTKMTLQASGLLLSAHRLIRSLHRTAFCQVEL